MSDSVLEKASHPEISCSTFDKKDRTLKPLSSESLSIDDSLKEQKWGKKGSSTINNSTLSLHISAYENNSGENESKVDGGQLLSNKSTSKNIGKSLKGSRELVFNSASKDLFEIPRQQKDGAGSEPEIMQFKASQKLLDSKSKAEIKKFEFEKFKEEANKLFKAEKYNESLEAYNQIFGRFDSIMDRSQKAIIYSNRSATYLMLNNEASIKKAKSDAEKAIKLNPSWWRGYFRMGRVQATLEEWKEAEKSFEKSLALNSESKEIRDELSVVRAQIGTLFRQDNLDPSCRPRPKEQQFKEAAIRAGISQKQIEEMEQQTLKTPGLGDTLRGHYYRDGIYGLPQDYKKAFECYMKAVKYDIPDAMYNLGRMYQNGFGVKRDYKESMKWLLKAAAAKPITIKGSGVAEAQHLIGLNYFEGVGVDKDIKKAVEWYEKAVKNDFAPSANNLGLLYQEGHGVEKSATKAFNYFKFAAQQGETPPMINLARCYFHADGTGSLIPTPEDIDEGKKWLRLAAEKGDIRAAQELQQRENMSAENVMFESLRGFMLKERDEKKNPLNYEEYGKYIEDSAKKGSLTAKRHLDIWKHMDDATKAFKKNDSGGVVRALAKAIRLDQQIAKVPDLFKPVIEERIKSHPNELDAIVCHIDINSKDPITPSRVAAALQIYPTDEYLLETMFACFSVMENKEGALECTKLALQFHPNSLRLRFCHALALMEFDDKKAEYFQALNDFLAMAPKDNDKIPECYYRKAMHCDNKSPEFIEAYEAGLAAEKIQLPCFLPYYFKAKSILEKLYSVAKIEASKNDGSSSKKKNGQAPAAFNPLFEKVKNDPKRKLLIVKNREMFVTVANPPPYTSNLTIANLPNTPNPPSTKNLKKIMIKDMDPTKDKVYNGFVLEGRLIDWAVRFTGIANILEDENGDVQRVGFYNWPSTKVLNFDVLNAIKTFQPNFKISIINPYMRMAMDGSNVIRVEGPEFVKIDKISPDQKCHCCGKEAKILPCSGCMLAKYCSKECQKFDWIEFNHKSICKHLKSFAQNM